MRLHWIEETGDLLLRMRDYLLRWGELNLQRAKCANRFLAFLALPGAVGLRLDCLRLISSRLEQSGGELWSDRHEDTDQALAELLDACIHSHVAEIKSDSQLTTVFQQLLARLVARQNPHALVIRDRFEASLRSG